MNRVFIPDWVRIRYVQGTPIIEILKALQENGLKVSRRSIERRAITEGWSIKIPAPPVAPVACPDTPPAPIPEAQRDEWVQELEDALNEIHRSRRKAPLEYLKLVRAARTIAAEIMKEGRFVRVTVEGKAISRRVPISAGDLNQILNALKTAAQIEDTISGFVAGIQSKAVDIDPEPEAADVPEFEVEIPFRVITSGKDIDEGAA